MNAFRWPFAAILIATLAIQGCASTGGVEYAKGTAPASASASAPASGTSSDEPIVKAETTAQFTALVSAVHQQMAPGGRWEFVDKDQRNTIDAKFADMQSQFDKYGSVDKMNDDAKTRLFNDQEVINGILTQNDSNRLICRRETPIGTHLSQKVCRTYGEIKQNRQDALDKMHELDQMQGQRRQITESPIHTANGSH